MHELFVALLIGSIVSTAFHYVVYRVFDMHKTHKYMFTVILVGLLLVAGFSVATLLTI